MMQLDARQRAMLEEMGVRVFRPEPPVGLMDDAPPGPPRGGEAAVAAAPVAVARPATRSEVPAASTAMRALPADIAAMDWDALQQTVASCQACGLCQSRKNTVFGVGDTQARWMVVGEAPGEHEDLQGEPFVGQAGQLLDNMLKALGLDRRGQGAQAVYIANVL